MMKKLNLLLTMIVTLSLSVFTYAGSDDCTDGQVWNSSLNRCVLSTNTVETLSSASNCQEKTGDAYSQCFYDNVDNQMAEAQAENEIPKASKPSSSYAISTIVTLGSGYILWKKSNLLQNCGQSSMWLMLGGGVSSLLGELYAQHSYKSKLKGLNKKYSSRMSKNPTEDNDATATSDNIVSSVNENQQIAFQFQSEQEQARAKAHKAREMTYKLAFGLYTASALASIWDFYQYGSAGCVTAAYTPMYDSGLQKQYAGLRNSLILNKNLFGEYYFIEELQQSEILEIVHRKVWSAFSFSAHAGAGMTDAQQVSQSLNTQTSGKIASQNAFSGIQTPTPATEGGKSLLDKVKGLADSADQMIEQGIKNPAYRAVAAGVLAGYSIYQGNQAGKLADQADKRVKYLSQLAADFEATGGVSFAGCTDSDRDDSSKASCYCYKADGSANTERSSSSICKTLTSSLSAYESDYSSTEKSKGYDDNSAGCLSGNSYDADCSSCADDSNGKGCFSMNGKVALGKLASIDGLTDAMKETAKFTSGKLGTSKLDSAASQNLALAANNAKKKLAASNPKIKKMVDKVNAQTAKLSRRLASSIARGVKNGSLSNPLSSSSLGGLDSGSELDEKIEEESKGEEIAAIDPKLATGGTVSGTGTSSPNLDFDFGDDSANKGAVEIAGNDSDEKKFKYEYNDINENKSANIFQIISNRYQSSGLKALFQKKK